ncbi:uncharacterized protein LOC108286354 [Cebus imitator]|uniref:uncharacterized protein LOC108286354 n=1 Tax=Cebus imitator TaxID=2715852 RepID=UPI00080A6FE5|nr:uncharacterized protein LOC108286354 [Cebus imitator]
MAEEMKSKLKNYKTAPFDSRFPNQNQTRNCWQNYLDTARGSHGSNSRGNKPPSFGDEKFRRRCWAAPPFSPAEPVVRREGAASERPPRLRSRPRGAAARSTSPRGQALAASPSSPEAVS